MKIRYWFFIACLFIGILIGNLYTNGIFGCEEWDVKNKDLRIVTFTGNTEETNNYLDWINNNGWNEIYDYKKVCVGLPFNSA